MSGYSFLGKYVSQNPVEVLASSVNNVPNGSEVVTAAVDMINAESCDFEIVFTAMGGGMTDILVRFQWSFDGTNYGYQYMEYPPATGVIVPEILVYDYDATVILAAGFPQRIPVNIYRQGGRRFVKMTIEGTGATATCSVNAMTR